MRVTSASNWSSFAAREPAIPPPITTPFFPCLYADSIPDIFFAIQAPNDLLVLLLLLLLGYVVLSCPSKLNPRVLYIYTEENRKIDQGENADVFSDFRYLKKNLMWSFLCVYVIEYVNVGRTLFQFLSLLKIIGPLSFKYWAENEVYVCAAFFNYITNGFRICVIVCLCLTVFFCYC